MKFSVKTRENILGLGRVIGYKLLGNRDGEFGFTRAFHHSGYPRFHIYVKKVGEVLFFNLHLDQKKPSYRGSAAHSGEYDGELVEREAERIKSALAKRG